MVAINQLLWDWSEYYIPFRFCAYMSLYMAHDMKKMVADEEIWHLKHTQISFVSTIANQFELGSYTEI